MADTVSITEHLAYDALGRVTQSRQTTAGVAYNLSYTYNLAGGLERITYPSGRQVTTCYDPSGQPDNVQNKSPWNLALNVDYLTSAVYTLHGAPQTLHLASGAVETRGYNSALQPESVALAKGGATLLHLGLCYTCSGANNGNVQRQTITIPGASWVQNYTYDAYGRLKSATEGAWSQTYVYDPWGNRAVLAGGWVPNPMWTPQTPNQSSVPYTAANRWTGAAYDNAGNVTQVGTAAMTYDGENRLRTGGGAVYDYDADGRRVKRVQGGVTTVWVYDAFGRLAAEYATAAQPSLGRVYVTPDHLGSTRLLTDIAGDVVRRYDYLPFGETIHAPNGGRTAAMKYTDSLFADASKARFTGKERDAETGLDYFGARYMSAAQGRFTTPDPIWIKADRLVDPQRLNLYAYGRNNPLRFSDPTGMDITIGQCNLGSTEECFKRLQEGLRKEDRAHVRLFVGEGKEGYKKGQTYLLVDKDYKSSSKNFQTLQALANDRTATAQLNVVGPKEAIASDIGVRDAGGTVVIRDAKAALGMYLTLEQGWLGQTFFQNWGGTPVENAWYSKKGFTEVGISTDQTVEQMVQTMHHELRHVLLGDFGRTVGKGVHLIPAVDQATKEAETEATLNRRRP